MAKKDDKIVMVEAKKAFRLPWGRAAKGQVIRFDHTALPWLLHLAARKDIEIITKTKEAKDDGAE